MTAAPSATTLRRMRWWDIDAVLSIEGESFHGSAWSAAQFWGELAKGNRRYVVAEDPEGIVGYAGLMMVPPTADVQTIAVSPRARRRGNGRALLRCLLDTAHESGCSEVLLEVRADSAAAAALYESEGFTVIARRSAYYGPGADALVMRRRPR